MPTIQPEASQKNGTIFHTQVSLFADVTLKSLLFTNSAKNERTS